MNKFIAPLCLLLVFAAGCTNTNSSSHTRIRTSYAIDSRLGTYDRLMANDEAIKSRTRTYEKQGHSPEEARGLAEAEYLKSNAGSVTGR